MEAVTGRHNPEICTDIKQSGNSVEIEISDNGHGIPDEIVESIFVPFFTTHSNGSGIGLSLARQITIMHGGELELAASSQTGSTFRLILPASLKN